MSEEIRTKKYVLNNITILHKPQLCTRLYPISEILTDDNLENETKDHLIFINGFEILVAEFTRKDKMSTFTYAL